jgi:polyhydroxyalkanoate synthase subunit PhaC
LKRRFNVPAWDSAIEVGVDAIRTQFGTTDLLRRAQGNLIAMFGLGPNECSYRIVASGPYWRLRHYGAHDTTDPLLIIAAPIKRPYIWDLAPSVSVIRNCLARGLDVHLLEWLPASPHTGNNGLEEYLLAISECIQRIRREGVKPVVMGHSFGGTLAAMYGCIAPATIRRVVILAAPLCFKHKSDFRDVLIGLVPANLPAIGLYPGSLLSQMSALASPRTFVWSRLADAALSFPDPHAMEVNARVERWTLDEIALPGKLVHQIVQWLYRENRLCHNELRIGEKIVHPSNLSLPILVAINTDDEVAPLASVQPFIDQLPKTTARLIRTAREVGVSLQHLAVLVGRQARVNIWPELISWLKSQN